MTVSKIERRFVAAVEAPAGIETRADGKKYITGYAAVFYREGDAGSEYKLWERAVERIQPGAFDRALKEKHDVRGLYNHDSSYLLGRSSNGTCTLSVDKRGLKYDIPYDENDPDHQKVGAKMTRGDLTGSSFAFRATGVNWQDGGEDMPEVRWITDLELYDVGPVTYPAYASTTTGVRSEDGLNEVREEHKGWVDAGKPSAPPVEQTEERAKVEGDPASEPPVEDAEARTEDEVTPTTIIADGDVPKECVITRGVFDQLLASVKFVSARIAAIDQELETMKASRTTREDEIPAAETDPEAGAEETREVAAELTLVELTPEEDLAMRRRKLDLMKLKVKSNA